MNSMLSYADHYQKGIVSEDREDRTNNISDNGENKSKENKEKKVTVEKEDTKGGQHIFTYWKYAHWIFWEKQSVGGQRIATLSSQ